VFDLRNLTNVFTVGGRQYVKPPMPSIEIADKDAAIMWALLRLNG
jgi:hypothetical protein